MGWGEAASVRTAGPDRFVDAREWWVEHASAAVVRDEVALPGTGLVSFGSFAFADGSARARRARGASWVAAVTEPG